MSKILKIGTRGSPLALTQARQVEAALKAAHADLETEIVPILTSGDWKPEDGEARLSEAEGGKGLFARELEKALLANEIDIAVHSLKDMDSFLPKGLALDHVMEREDARDAFISFNHASIMELPEGAVVGTSSVRRQSFLLARRPDLKIVPLRGNVQTRIDKLKAGQVDATFLAMAGLNRLGIAGDFINPVSTDIMLPACAQGIIGIERRAEDEDAKNLLDAIHHSATGFCAAAERAALQALDGSCRTPIGAYARWAGNILQFNLCVASADGAQLIEESDSSPLLSQEEAFAMGKKAGEKLRAKIPRGFLS